MGIKKKGDLIFLASIITICVLAVLGFRGFVNSIRNQRTCEWANIDNIELHAHIDVPRVTKWDCDYEKVSNTKRASFTVDKKNVNIDEYIKNYHFKKLHSPTDFEDGRFLNLNKESLGGADLYYKKNPADGERFDVLFDKATARLWVTIEYKD